MICVRVQKREQVQQLSRTRLSCDCRWEPIKSHIYGGKLREPDEPHWRPDTDTPPVKFDRVTAKPFGTKDYSSKRVWHPRRSITATGKTREHFG